jgi:hypothetical protein
VKGVKNLKKVLAVIVSCALILQGCTGVIVKKAEKPTEVTQKVIPPRMVLETSIPAGEYRDLKWGGRPVKAVDKNTVKWLQEEATETGKTIFVNRTPLLIETMGGDKKWYRGFAPRNTIFLADRQDDPQTGIEEYRLTKLGICRNPVRGTTIKIIPRTVVVTEKYRDIDYTPAIWTGLGGLVLGGVIGWLIHPSAPTTTILGGAPGCPPGMPPIR